MKRCVIGLMVVLLVSMSAQAVLVNGDFEADPQSGGNQAISTTGPDFGWTAIGTAYYNNLEGEWQPPKPAGYPGATNLYFTSNRAEVYQDVAMAWDSSTTFEISFLATVAGWRSGVADAATVALKLTDGTVLWSDTLNLIGSSLGSTNPTGGSWYSYSQSIAASDFTAAASGSEIRLSLSNSLPVGGSVYFADDVSMTMVPEPATMALMGFGGLFSLLRRKK